MRHPEQQRFLRSGRATSKALIGALVLLALSAAAGAELRVDVSPGRAYTLPGGEARFAAEVRDDGQVVDATVTWSLIGAGIGSIEQSGLFTAGSTPGRGIVRAVARLGDEQASGHAVIEVGAEAPQRLSVRVEPERTVLEVGEEARFEAVVTDPVSGDLVDADISWVVIPEDLGTIDEAGLFTAASAGPGRVAARASSDGRGGVGNASVVVGTAWEADIQVRVTPVRAVVGPGGGKVFEAAVVDAAGRPVDADVEWDVLPRGIGTIDDAGRFIGGPEASAGRVVASVPTETGVERGLANVEVRPHGPGGVAVRVRPREAALPPGGDVMFQAMVVGPGGEDLTVPVEWTVNPSWLGTISQDGFFVAAETFPEPSVNGFWTGTVVASIEGIAGDAARVVIHEQGGAYRLRIAPPRAVVFPGVEFQFETDIVGAGDPGAWSVEWAVFPDDLGTISPDGVFSANPAFADPASGLFGPREGVVAARATLQSGGVLTARAHVSVRLPGLPVRIDVRPALAIVPPGGSRQFEARVIGPDGDATELPVRWSVTPASIGTVTSDGLFTAADVVIDPDQWQRPHGRVIAEARLGNGAVYRGAGTVVLDLPDPEAVVRVSPKAVTLDPGESVAFSADVTTVDGAPLDIQVLWRVGNEAVGTVAPDGLFTAAMDIAPGQERQTAVTAGVEYEGRVYWDVATVRVRRR